MLQKYGKNFKNVKNLIWPITHNNIEDGQQSNDIMLFEIEIWGMSSLECAESPKYKCTQNLK